MKSKTNTKKKITKKKVLLLIIIIAAIYVVGTLAITALTFHGSFGPSEMEEDSTIAHWDYYENDYTRQEITFDSRGNELVGAIYQAENPKGLIVLSHGIWSGPEDYLAMITWFVDQGWDVFTYSYTAYNGSQGDSAKGLPQSPIDLDAALTYIVEDPELASMPRIIMGHSWGAYASTAVLNYGHEADGIVALSGFSDPVEIATDVAANMIGPIGRTIGWSINLFDHILFSKEEARQLAVDGINATDAPVLLLHGENDSFISFTKTSIISHKDEITNPNVTYIILDDPDQSDHNNYFGNADATAYYEGLNEEYEELESQYKKDVPEDVKEEFYAKVDYARANQPNVELFQQLEDFMTQAISQ